MKSHLWWLLQIQVGWERLLTSEQLCWFRWDVDNTIWPAVHCRCVVGCAQYCPDLLPRYTHVSNRLYKTCLVNCKCWHMHSRRADSVVASCVIAFNVAVERYLLSNLFLLVMWGLLSHQREFWDKFWFYDPCRLGWSRFFKDLSCIISAAGINQDFDMQLRSQLLLIKLRADSFR